MSVVALLILFALVQGCASGNARNDEAIAEAATARSGITAEALERHTRYLASDELEGRAPGSRGEELTLTYLTEQYADMGLRPGNPDGTYVQAVQLIGSTVTNVPALKLTSPKGERVLEYVDEFMGWTLRQVEDVSVEESELVFVGYGVVAPEYNWDDYKDVDVTGKVIVMLVGDPPLPDSTQFGGRAMTYYGRWTYKYEIAAEKGAAGAMIVHNEPAAGYPWGVVSNSWSGEQFDIVRDNQGVDRCALEGWFTEDVARSVFAAAGIDLDDAYRDALSRDFRPVSLRTTADITIKNKFRNVRSYNVVALLPGNDPELKNEFVIYTAHWDHLGIGNPLDGDSIYNGALDNASGVAATLEIAGAFSRHRAELARSVLILNTTAEESGLLGAYHYAANPLHPLEDTVALINMDGLNVWGRTKDVVIVGFGFSELDGYLESAVASHNRYIRPDTEPEKGYYYRSDHLAFAKKGVPSLYADSGVEFIGRPRQWGVEVKEAWTRERYHKPTDEITPDWNMSGAVEDAEAYFRVGLMIARTDVWPRWSETSEFREVREQSLGGAR